MANIHNTTVSAPSTSTGKGTVPTAVSQTGTLTSVGARVVGVGTLFTTELKVGDFLFNTTAAVLPQVRRIKHILDNTRLILDSGFSVDVAGIAVSRVRGEFKSVGVVNSGAADGVLNEGTLVAGASPSYDAKAGFVVEPFSFNATGTTFNIFPTK